MDGSKTILVPIDFEAASAEAISQARDLGEKLGLEVVLLHVYSVPSNTYPGIAPILGAGLCEEIHDAAATTLERFADENGHLRAILRCGDPAGETLDVIERTRPEMVVMGTHARTGLAHFLLGSVAEDVARKSPVPVLTFHSASA
jgi:nucleotide-binding universal stress UspA family protein